MKKVKMNVKLQHAHFSQMTIKNYSTQISVRQNFQQTYMNCTGLILDELAVW